MWPLTALAEDSMKITMAVPATPLDASNIRKLRVLYTIDISCQLNNPVRREVLVGSDVDDIRSQPAAWGQLCRIVWSLVLGEHHYQPIMEEGMPTANSNQKVCNDMSAGQADQLSRERARSYVYIGIY
jgi:hypothetical protein